MRPRAYIETACYFYEVVKMDEFSELNEVRDKVRFLLHALDESVKLQSHYAELLNAYDGGKRLSFPRTSDWLERLRKIKHA